MANEDLCRMRIVSEEYRDFILTVYGGRATFNIPEEQLCIQNAGGGYEIVYADQGAANPINLERYTYNAIPQCYTLLDMDAMNQAGIIQVQNYPTLQLMGENIMIGFIDTGIDYTNSVFRNLDGTTRIAGIWDQADQSGSVPDDFLYGSEYTREQINEALASDNPLEVVPVEDTNGHGTYVASLAAGGADPENRFIGGAPESTIAVVKLKEAKQYLREFYFIPESADCYQENDIMLGIRYLLKLAEAQELPLVICLALGTSMGGHNGSTPLAVVLELYAQILNIGIVTGTGNEANQRHHFFGKLESQSDSKEVEIRVGNNVEGFIAELWTDIPNLMTVSIVSPSGERIPRIPLRQGTNAVFTFTFERSQVYVDNRILVERNNSQLIFFRFGSPSPGIWKIIVEPAQVASGEFHVWLPMKEFLSGEVYFLQSNPDTTLTTPSGVYNAISVAFYNGTENSVDINSGRGYTRTGRIKPDFAAPGVNVMGAAPGGRFITRSGSSAAVGITAGATALLLEWINNHTVAVGADTLQLKNLFIIGAVQRPNMEYPNKEWGFGTLDLYNTLDRLRQL